MRAMSEHSLMFDGIATFTSQTSVYTSEDVAEAVSGSRYVYILKNLCFYFLHFLNICFRVEHTHAHTHMFICMYTYPPTPTKTKNQQETQTINNNKKSKK